MHSDGSVTCTMATEQPDDTPIFKCHGHVSLLTEQVSQKDESWAELLAWFVAVMADYRAALVSPKS